MMGGRWVSSRPWRLPARVYSTPIGGTFTTTLLTLLVLPVLYSLTAAGGADVDP